MLRSLVTPRYMSALPAAAIIPPLTFLLPSNRPKPYNARAPPLITDNHGSMSLTRSQAPPPLRPPLRSERELFMDSSLRKVTEVGCGREVRGLAQIGQARIANRQSSIAFQKRKSQDCPSSSTLLFHSRQSLCSSPASALDRPR